MNLQVRLITIALLLAAGGSLLWWHARDPTVTVRITQEHIDKALAKKFPKQKNYLVLLQATFLNPRASLLPEQEKIRLGADVDVRLLGTSEDDALTGSLDVLTAVRYEPATRSFFLDDPTIEKLAIQDLPDKYVSLLSNLALEFARDSVENTSVYTLDESEAKEAAAGLLLRKIEIRSDAIHVTLGL